jgi:hypothetical protein
MNDRIDEFRSRNDGVVVPRIWVAFALSVLLHVATLLGTPQTEKMQMLPPSGEDPQASSALSLRLMPPAQPSNPATPAPPRPPRPPPESVQLAQRPKTIPPRQSAPPVIALNKPTPAAPSTTVPIPAPPPRPAVEGDLDAYIEARRRARGAATPATPATVPAEDEEARRQRIIAGNLGSTRERTFGYDPRQGGGMFQIESLSSDHAEFIFYGWNSNINRNTKQLIDVRRGNNSDIRIAVVRRMIAIIRENAQEDFLWMSQRLGRTVSLSARARDNSGLEEFMMREFFFEAPAAQR